MRTLPALALPACLSGPAAAWPAPEAHLPARRAQLLEKSFLAYSVRRGTELTGVRIPTWAVAEVKAGPGQPLTAPMFHSAYLLVLFRKGRTEPEAAVRWFQAVPHTGNQGTLYSAAHHRRRAWTDYGILRAW